jgi:hypothetical protein
MVEDFTRVAWKSASWVRRETIDKLKRYGDDPSSLVAGRLVGLTDRLGPV